MCVHVCVRVCVCSQPDVWRTVCESGDPDQCDALHTLCESMGMRPCTPLPAPEEGDVQLKLTVPHAHKPLNGFLSLLLVKVLCEDKLGAAITR